MKTQHSIPDKPAITFVLFLVVFGAFFRVLRLDFFPDAQNFAPLMAIACCGALFLPGWLALAAPLGALIISDIVLDLHYGASIFEPEVLIRYACFGAGVAGGLAMRRVRSSPVRVLGFVAANSLLFYLVTNTASWITEPAYVKTAAGWLQALTIGVPGHVPTWMFFRNSLASDLLFTAVFLAAARLASRRAEPALARA